MFKFNNNFIGYKENQNYEKFSGPDSEELYLKNLKNKPDDWYYRNNTFDYKRNTLGHRTPKEIGELDLDNYILTIGCSHTEGIGIPI